MGEDQMLCLQRHLEVCKQSLDTSCVPDLELEARSRYTGDNRADAAAAAFPANAEDCTGFGWTLNCLGNGSQLHDGDGDGDLAGYDGEATWSCRAVVKELPSPIRRTTQAFRLAHCLALYDITSGIRAVILQA